MLEIASRTFTVHAVSCTLSGNFGTMGDLRIPKNCLPGSRLVVTRMLAALPEGCFTSVKP